MRAATEQERQECDTCRAPYAPRLTDGACPVCATPAPGFTVTKRWWSGSGDPFLRIALLALAANFVILAVFIAHNT